MRLIGRLGAFRAAQHQHMRHAAPAHLGGAARVAGGGPHTRMRPLVRPRPDVHVPVAEVLALPAERAVVASERLLDQVDRLPVPLLVVDRLYIGACHLGAAGLDEAYLEAATQDRVGGGVFLGHAHRVRPQGDERAEAQHPHILRLPRQDAGDHRVGADHRVDAGMVLDADDVHAEFVAERELIQYLVEQVGRAGRVAIAVGQAGPD